MSVGANVRGGDELSIGNSSTIWAPRHLLIGKRVALGTNVRIEVDGLIGDHVLIANGAAVVGRRDHDVSKVGVSVREATWVGDDPDALSDRTTIGSDVWVGYGATILSGVSIGDSCVIGAGSLVVDDIPPNSIAVGVPARVIRTRFPAEQFAAHWAALSAKGIRTSDELAQQDRQ